MVKVNWSSRAWKDLQAIHQYISKDSALYASRFINLIITHTDILIEFPLSGRIVPEKNDETIRELIEGNYRIFYKVKSARQITILRIHHSARKIG